MLLSVTDLLPTAADAVERGAVIVTTVITAGFMISKAIKSLATSFSTAFSTSVETYVKPIMGRLNDSLDDVSSTLQTIQAEHARTAEHFKEDRRMKEGMIAAHTVQLDGHTERLNDHAERIATVEGRLDAI